MVDIHSHILPGLDDGAETFDQSVRMLQMAAEDGITDIVASPHSDLRFAYNRELVGREISRLQEACSDIRLHRGCDFHMVPDRIHQALIDPSYFSIDGLGYLLVEFPELVIPDATDDVLFRMVQRGLFPVLTHPERNRVLQRDRARLAYWIDQGCRVQVTAQSLLGRFGRTAQRVARDLMNDGQVHFVATDAHDDVRRPPILSSARRQVETEFGNEVATLVFETNPSAALKGAPVERTMPKPKRSLRRWVGF